MTPGLIDNHNHLIYNASIWPNNASLSDARTRTQALDILAAKVQEVGPGDSAEHVVFGIGGWKPLQFADNPSVLTRAELDRVAPNNLLIVGSWGGMTLNTKAMEFAGTLHAIHPIPKQVSAGSGAMKTAIPRAISPAASF